MVDGSVTAGSEARDPSAMHSTYPARVRPIDRLLSIAVEVD